MRTRLQHQDTRICLVLFFCYKDITGTIGRRCGDRRSVLRRCRRIQGAEVTKSEGPGKGIRETSSCWRTKQRVRKANDVPQAAETNPEKK